jgi:hypothetical protein
MSSDVPFFPHQPNANAGRAPRPTKPVVENAVLQYIYEHNNPSIIHYEAVKTLRVTLQSGDPQISERDIEIALKKYGYVLDEISSELGDYTFIGRP